MGQVESGKASSNKAVWFAVIMWSFAALFVLYQFLLQASISVMIPGLMHSFRLTTTDVGVLSASFFYPYLLLQIPAGIMVDRLGIRRLLILSLAICFCSTILFAVASSGVVAELARLLMGISCAPGVVCAMCLASRWFSGSLFAMFAGMVEMLGMLGGAMGEYFMSIFVDSWGWRGSMWAASVMAAVLLIGVVLLVRDWPSKAAKDLHFADHKQTDAADCLWAKCCQVIANKQVWLACLYGGLLFSLVTAFASLWAVPFLQVKYPIANSTAAAISSVMFLGVAAGAPIMGWLSQCWGGARRLMIIMGSLAFLLFASLLWLALPLWLAYIVMFVLGFVTASYVLSFSVVKTATSPKVHGMALGFANMMVILLGAPLMQPLIGWILSCEQCPDHGLTSSDYRYALLIILGCLALALLISLGVKESKPVEAG